MPNSCKCILDHLLYKSAITVDQYDKILRNLKGTEWHPYPKETPSYVGRYIVQRKDGTIEISDCEYYGYSGTYQFDTNNVIAWAYLPDPYEEGAEE